MIGYVKCFDSNKKMSFIADDKELLKKYIEIWEKINGLIGKKFDCEPVYGDKYLKIKIKSYKSGVSTNFRGEGNSKRVPKEGLLYMCLTLIVLDSVIKTGNKYYPQTLLEECKYKLTKKKVEDLIADDFDSSSESSDKSDNEVD